VHSVFGKINYGGLKHNSLYLGLVLQLVGDRASFYELLSEKPLLPKSFGGKQIFEYVLSE
jgi:hypothetical protein